MTLIHGNAFEIIDKLDDGSIDMVLTDPPYEIQLGGGGMFKDRKFLKELECKNLHNSFDITNFLTMLIPKFKTKNHYNVVIFLSMNQLYKYLAFAIEHKYQHKLLFWHKSDPPPFVNNTYLNDVELCLYIKGNKVRIGGDYHTKSLVYKSSVNRKDKKLYNHPTIKPIPLLEKYLINHSSEGDVVLDPFMGTGSTGVACKNLGRKFIGVELLEEYYNTALERLNKNQK